MLCPKCASPLHPSQKRCNHCATKVAYCANCQIMNLASLNQCKQCQNPLPKPKSFKQLELEYYSRKREEAIRFLCICGKPITVNRSQAGKYGKCPKCGYKLIVPHPAELSSSDSDEDTPHP